MPIKLPSTLTRGKNYFHLSIPHNGDWINATILPFKDLPKEAFDGKQNYANHVFYEEGDTFNESLIVNLAMEIRALAAHHACIDALCRIGDNEEQILYWVYAENKSHVRRLGVKKGNAIPINMYAGNCFYTEVEAEAFREELKSLFTKYGIDITYIK